VSQHNRSQPHPCRRLRAALLPRPEHDSIALTVETRPQRCGRAVRLVVSPAEVSTVTAQESPALVKVLAQGQLWLEQLLDGKVSSLRSIANSAGLSERYVSQVIRSAFLAPDLVETVLQGRQPAHLTVRQVTKQLPCDWSEQRRMFGLAPGGTAQCHPLRGSCSESIAAPQRYPRPPPLGAVRLPNRTEVRIQLAPPSSPVRTIAISCSISFNKGTGQVPAEGERTQ